MGNWGLGIGDWAQSPIPNPQSPIPNPQLYLYFLYHYFNSKAKITIFLFLLNLKMGKKSKMYRSGLPRNQIKKSQNKPIPKIQINPQPQSTEPVQKKYIKLVPQINYNLDALKKANETLGLSQDQIKTLYTRPLRNRRYVNNLTLTKREKKRELRKMKKELKQQMEDKTKLDITLNPNLHYRNKIEENLNVTKSLKRKEEKNKMNRTSAGFNFGEMDDIINDMVEDTENKMIKENNKNKSSMRNKNQRNLIYNEANEINNILNNKEFLSDPNATLKMQIQEQQKIKERNEKIKEEFNKNYNFLNLK